MMPGQPPIPSLPLSCQAPVTGPQAEELVAVIGAAPGGRQTQALQEHVWRMPQQGRPVCLLTLQEPRPASFRIPAGWPPSPTPPTQPRPTIGDILSDF